MKSKQILPINKLSFTLSLLMILWLVVINSKDYGFYYDNFNEEILFDTENNLLSDFKYQENDLLKPSNMQKEYFSSAKDNKFKMQYFLCNIFNLSSSPINLIKASFNITFPEKSTIKEVIIDLSETKENKLIFPKKYNDEFSIEQNKTAINKGRKNRSTIIYDTFGFNIKSKNNLNFKIIKLILVNYRKNKLNYLNNLSGNVQNTDDKNNTFDIYLKNMPENFDLYITLEIFNKNWEDTGEKILIVQKDFNYPNFWIEKNNPNIKMLLICLVFIIIAFILIVVLVILKLICGLGFCC